MKSDVSIRYNFFDAMVFLSSVAVVAAFGIEGRVSLLLLPCAVALFLIGLRPVVKVSPSRVLIRNLWSTHEFAPGDGRLSMHDRDWRLLYLGEDDRWHTATAASKANEDIQRQPKRHIRLEAMLREYGYLQE